MLAPQMLRRARQCEVLAEAGVVEVGWGQVAWVLLFGEEFGVGGFGWRGGWFMVVIMGCGYGFRGVWVWV